MMQGIYEIRNQVDGRRYIGSSVDVESRWAIHCWALKERRHGNNNLQAAWDRFGQQNFGFRIIEEVANRTDLLDREQDWLDRCFRAEELYNISRDARDPPSALGRKRSPETCEKMSISLKKAWANGRVWSSNPEETKAKMGAAHKGSVPWNKGRKCPNTSQSLIDYYAVHEHKRKGCKLSEEAKQRLRGRKLSCETRQKISKALMGTERHAKPYPALYNSYTGRYISQGINLAKMCRENGLGYGTIWPLVIGRTLQTKGGWRLAVSEDIETCQSTL